jgi:hypothetical protein
MSIRRTTVFNFADLEIRLKNARCHAFLVPRAGQPRRGIPRLRPGGGSKRTEAALVDLVDSNAGGF